MRPLPHIPRGPRRRPETRSRQHLLACPRVSPKWELAAIHALIKPQTRDAITHTPALQTWPVSGSDSVRHACAGIHARLGVNFSPHFPEEGDFFFVLPFPESDGSAARALALILSLRLPGMWFTLDRLFACDGRFYRRRRGVMLTLREARDVRLPRTVRAALGGLLPRVNNPATRQVSARNGAPSRPAKRSRGIKP